MSQRDAIVSEKQVASHVVSADLRRMTEDLEAEFASMAGDTLLITGGAGFLGYYLVQAPLAWNDRGVADPIRVVVFDNFLRGVPEWLTDLADRDDLEVRTHDLRDPLPTDMPVVDHIIHAAGIASPTVYRAHPIETMDANIDGLRTLLNHAESRRDDDRPVRNFLFFSSSEIYGDPTPDAIPTPETYRGFVSCTGPRACYDESKRYGETLCVNFTRARGVRTTIARPFNNYGPGMKITDGRVIADFCRAILENRDIVMFSDGSPTRTFCYASDAVTGYFKVLIRGRDGESYNIGVGTPEISMADLARRVRSQAEEMLGYGGQVVLGESVESDYLVDNPNRRCPDISKAEQDLDYRPRIDLHDGLASTLRWYLGNRQGGEN